MEITVACLGAVLFYHLRPPGEPDTITIIAREIATGIVYSITANDEREAMAKLRDRIFD
jgi:hypothetical protein